MALFQKVDRSVLDEAVTKEEAELRDGLETLLRDTGLDVIMDADEGLRVLKNEGDKKVNRQEKRNMTSTEKGCHFFFAS